MEKSIDSKDFEDLYNRLKIWREERHITVEQQKENFDSLVEKEWLEHDKALQTIYDLPLIQLVSAKTIKCIHELVDALCQIAVVCINADYMLHEDLVRVSNGVHFSLNFIFDSIKAQGFVPYECMLETIKHISARKGRWVKDNTPVPQPNYFKHIIDSEESLHTI